jgi:uncharacterized protein (DUF433 family)/DNA-binding transcriptional MerR regulator
MSEIRPSLLKSGIYTIPEVAELVGAPAQSVRIWVEGHKNKQAPLIKNQLGRVGERVAVSFTNLMELRFIARFRAAGVSLKHIRTIMGDVEAQVSHPHPFATKLVFRTDGRKILLETAVNNKIKKLVDMKTKNFEMIDVVLNSLKEDVIFDVHGEATSWRPRPKQAPNVIVHPSYAFGKPVLRDSRVPTETIAQAVKVEGSADAVSDLYEVPVRQVREAVRFEELLRQAA